MTTKTDARSWLNTIMLALFAIIVGSIVAYASLGFLVAIGWLHEFFVAKSGAALYTRLTEIPRVYLFILPVFGAVIVSIIVRYGSPEHRNHGPADVIYAARLGNGDMSIRAGLTNALASIISIGSGASVGRYGPIVHLGATLGAWLAKSLRLKQNQRKTLLACGVAGAISASFSAPLAGVVFAHEVVIGRFDIRSVVPIVISSVVATTIASFHGVSNTLFILPNLSVETTWEYFLFVLVGAVGGGLAVLFMATMHRFGQIAQRTPGPPVLRALLGGLCLGGVVVIFPQTFGHGEQVIQNALMLEMTAGIMVALVVAKLLATSISFAAGFTGGVFGPALYIGAMMGTAVGFGVNELTDFASSPAVYGIVGMGAVISRVVGSPIATILIIFELTASYSLTTAVMVSVVVGSTVTRDFFNRSFFYFQLRERGIDPDEPPAQQLLREIPINTLIDKKPVVITDVTTVAVARDTMIKQGKNEAFIINDEGQLLGQISAVMLLELNNEVLLSKPVAHFIIKPILILHSQMNILEAYSKIQDFVDDSFPVVDVNNETSSYFMGVVYKSMVIHSYLNAIKQSQQEDN